MTKKSAALWLEEKIQQTISSIDKNSDPSEKDIKKLHALITMKKKYEHNPNSSSLRIMEKFVDFLILKYPKTADKWKKVCEEFLRSL